jgi:hypothetical protein
MPIPSDAEVGFFETAVRSAYRLRGSNRPDWYLLARLDQMLDDHCIDSDYERMDVGSRGLFILRQFVQMPPDKEQLRVLNINHSASTS